MVKAVLLICIKWCWNVNLQLGWRTIKLPVEALSQSTDREKKSTLAAFLPACFLAVMGGAEAGGGRCWAKSPFSSASGVLFLPTCISQLIFNCMQILCKSIWASVSGYLCSEPGRCADFAVGTAMQVVTWWRVGADAELEQPQWLRSDHVVHVWSHPTFNRMSWDEGDEMGSCQA